MVKLKSATMLYNDKEIEMKEVDTESCVQLYFEILGSKFEFDYLNADIEDIINSIDLKYNTEDGKFKLVNFEYRLVFEVEVEIDGVISFEEFVIEGKDEDGEPVWKTSLFGTFDETTFDESIEELYNQLLPNVQMHIGSCFQI